MERRKSGKKPSRLACPEIFDPRGKPPFDDLDLVKKKKKKKKKRRATDYFTQRVLVLYLGERVSYLPMFGVCLEHPFCPNGAGRRAHLLKRHVKAAIDATPCLETGFGACHDVTSPSWNGFRAAHDVFEQGLSVCPCGFSRPVTAPLFFYRIKWSFPVSTRSDTLLV